MGLQVGGLSKLFIAAVERADVGSVSGVDPDVCAQVEVQREALPTAFKSALEGLLSCVNKLVSFKFGALDKSFSALGTDVHSRTMSVEVFPHG